jgi:hypothetical protein
MSKIVKLHILCEQMRSGDFIPLKFSYKTVDSSGKNVFKNKNQTGREILEWLLEHNFFSTPFQAALIALNFDLERFGKEDDFELSIDESINAISLSKVGETNGIQGKKRSD